MMVATHVRAKKTSPALTPRLKFSPMPSINCFPAVSTDVTSMAKGNMTVVPREENPRLTTTIRREFARSMPSPVQQQPWSVLQASIPYVQEAREGLDVSSPELSAVKPAAAHVILRNTVMAVATPTAVSTIELSPDLRLLTRGTDTCAVPTVNSDGIEFTTRMSPLTRVCPMGQGRQPLAFSQSHDAPQSLTDLIPGHDRNCTNPH